MQTFHGSALGGQEAFGNYNIGPTPRLDLYERTRNQVTRARKMIMVTTSFDLERHSGTLGRPAFSMLWSAATAENFVVLLVWNGLRTHTMLGSHRTRSGTHVGDLESRPRPPDSYGRLR